MTTLTLKERIREDINRLKQLDIDILPAGLFYPKVARLMAIFYLIVVGAPLGFTFLLKGSQLTAAFYFDDWIILSIFFMVLGFFTLSRFSIYVTFNETIKPHLLLGASIQRLFTFSLLCFSLVYLFWTSLYTAYFFTWDFSHAGERALTVIPGFIFGVFVSGILFESELTRIGAATIYEVIKNLKTKAALKTD